MKKWIWLIVLCLIIVCGAVVFYILSQPPKDKLTEEFKEEAVTKLLGRRAQLEAENVAQGNTEYNGRYISFQYPAKALIYTYRSGSSSATLEDFSFDIKSPKLVFNMKVSESGAELLDVPAVRLREQRLYEYDKEEITIDNVKGLTYYKRGQQPEKSGFFAAFGRLYTVSVTGVSDRDVARLFDDISGSVSFSKK